LPAAGLAARRGRGLGRRRGSGLVFAALISGVAVKGVRRFRRLGVMLVSGLPASADAPDSGGFVGSDHDARFAPDPVGGLFRV